MEVWDTPAGGPRRDGLYVPARYQWIDEVTAVTDAGSTTLVGPVGNVPPFGVATPLGAGRLFLLARVLVRGHQTFRLRIIGQWLRRQVFGNANYQQTGFGLEGPEVRVTDERFNVSWHLTRGPIELVTENLLPIGIQVAGALPAGEYLPPYQAWTDIRHAVGLGDQFKNCDMEIHGPGTVALWAFVRNDVGGAAFFTRIAGRLAGYLWERAPGDPFDEVPRDQDRPASIEDR